jgi:hypothetical protein
MPAVSSERWPALPYEAFAPTAYLLHMGVQAIGKLNLTRPFEPEWANVILYLTGRGLTSGLVPHHQGVFSVDIDLVSHEVRCATSWGRIGGFGLGPMSVAQFTGTLFATLRGVGVEAAVNPMPQEVPAPIPFDKDTAPRPYDRELAHAWWNILISSHRVMKRYHARFRGKTPPIGLMWGTLDLRDVRLNGAPASPGPKAGYIRRNAMDAAQIEAGWWSGTPSYPRPAYYSFTYPEPKEIAQAKVQPAAARWEPSMGEFILDYDDLRQSKDPEADLLAFLESTYRAGAERAGWDPDLVGAGEPV